MIYLKTKYEKNFKQQIANFKKFKFLQISKGLQTSPLPARQARLPLSIRKVKMHQIQPFFIALSLENTPNKFNTKSKNYFIYTNPILYFFPLSFRHCFAGAAQRRRGVQG